MGDRESSGRGSVSSLFGGAGWFVFWLFTVAFAQLSFGQALLAIFLWPWYLGVVLRP